MSGYCSDRYGQAYFGAEGFNLQIQTLVLADDLMAALTGSTLTPVTPFADVTVGGVALANVESIEIERSIWQKIGTCKIHFHTATSIATLIPNAAIIVTAGIRTGTSTVSQKLFVGRLDKYQAPGLGESLGVIDGYDNARLLQDQFLQCSMSGDVATWIASVLDGVSMGDDFQILSKCDPINMVWYVIIPGTLDAMVLSDTLINAFTTHYLFLTGMNELTILDPAWIAADDALFAYSKVLKDEPVLESTGRFNQVPYSFLDDYLVTYAGHPDSGTYNDTTDQATYGVMPHPGVQNGFCTTSAQFVTMATSIATESQRARKKLQVPFNPMIDLGHVLSYGGTKYFVAKILHLIDATRFWQTDLEVWEL